MGVITKNCKAKSLLPGARHIAPWKNLIIVNDKLSYEESAFLFDNYSCSKKLVDNTETLVVKEGEFAIRFVDDVYTGSYKPGTYHFLKSSSAKVVKTFDKNVLLPICSIGIVKKKKRRNRFGYAVLRYNYLVLKSFNYLSSFSVILFRTLQSKPFSEFIG